MAAIKLPIFSGMVPSVDKHLLSDQQAAYASNAWLYSGALSGLPLKENLHTMVNSAAVVAFRIPTTNVDPSYLFDSYWVEFTDVDTDFIKAPTAGDTFQRYYWCSPSEVPKYNTAARIVLGQPAWLLGLPSPGALNVTAASGTSATLVSRAYIATFVTAYGEEGPASAPFLINGKLDDTYTVTLPACLATDMGVNRNITKIRLYRTVTSASGVATYYQITEVTALTTTQTFADTALDTTIASNPILASTSWTAPPALIGMIAMPNGITAGYVGNQLWFSEAYRPHAWPGAYSLTLEHDIVGLGLIGQTLVVCTKGNPQTASGVNPSSITTAKLAIYEPCLAKGSIVSTEEGVYYGSPNGLVLVNPGVAENITKQYISRDKWNEIVASGHINGGKLGSAYFAFGSQIEGLFQSNMVQSNFTQIKIVTGGSTQGFMLDPSNQNVGFTFINYVKDVKSVSNDMLSGELLVVMDGKVWWLNQDPNYKVETYKWQSKVFQAPELTNFGAFKPYLYEDSTFIFPNAQNFDINQVFDPNTQRLVVRVYADYKLILAHEIRKSGELHRLPTGFKANFWQVEFEGIAKVKNFQMANSVKELASV